MCRVLTIASLCACAAGRARSRGDGGAGSDDAASDRAPSDGAIDVVAPNLGIPCVAGAGSHRLYLQGRNGTPDAMDRYPMLEDRAAIVHGEHYIIGRGAFVEWIAPLCGDLDGREHLYMPNNDVSGAVARYELFVERGDAEIPLGAADDTQKGNRGYIPFETDLSAPDPGRRRGDLLLLRVTNLTDLMYSVVVFNPPSEYMAWIDVTLH